ncbi:polysaccharide deacetylase family protein [Bacillus cereus]|uniref:polysaccharide deacetylase family protein n=1 Tax=Bacillus cereus TaxID=1396 RepID=UPI0018F47D6C|nr:polysaccharide deacetylase family protein [Bacillus cereus]MBJ8055420.1 polysaccharide deacetylase family protein [Bacillus cereus]
MKTEQIEIYVDGKMVLTTYYIQDGYVMVPVLFLKYAGILVDYNSKNHSIVLKKDKFLLTLFKNQCKSDVFIEGSKTVLHDSLLTAPIEINDTIYIPFFYVVQRLELVVWSNMEIPRIYLITNSLPKWNSNVYYRGAAAGNKIALTFDDGPDDYYTPKILDLLENKKVPATFFVVGQQIQWCPSMLKRVVKEGHALGNHSWSHPKFTNLTTSQIKEEISRTENEITILTGERKTTLFRPPYGEFTNADLNFISELGYKLIMWSVDTLDWTGLSAEEIIAIVRQDLSPGAIVLQHSLKMSPGILDGTVKALPILIDELIAKGYEFVTIDRLLKRN